MERFAIFWRGFDGGRWLRTPATKAIAIAVPVAILVSSNVSAASRTVSWDAAGEQSAGNPTWLDSLAGAAAQTSDGTTVAATDPDLPVLPAGGNPTNLVEVPTSAAAAAAQVAVNGTPMAAQVDLSQTPVSGETQVTAALAQSGIPVRVLKSYLAAAAITASKDPSCHLHWSLLAGIGRVESNHGRFGGATVDANGVVSPPIYGPRLDGSGSMALVRDTDGGRLDGDSQLDRAVGPMQFLPGTWVIYGADADGDGIANPQDTDDASLTAARYLCSGSSDLATQAGKWSAVLRYNHSNSYAAHVISLADSYATGTVVPIASQPAGVTLPAPTSRPAGAPAPVTKRATSAATTAQASATHTTPVTQLTQTTAPTISETTTEGPTVAPSTPAPTASSSATTASATPAPPATSSPTTGVVGTPTTTASASATAPGETGAPTPIPLTATTTVPGTSPTTASNATPSSPASVPSSTASAIASPTPSTDPTASPSAAATSVAPSPS